MRFSFARILLGVGVSLALISPSTMAQSIPVPEYYGIYAVIDGKLIKLDAQHVQLDKNVNVRMGQRNGVGNILNGEAVAGGVDTSVAKFSPDLKILVYTEPTGLQSALDVAKSLHLESLLFVRNVSVDTGFPSNVRRSGYENGWEAGDAPELFGGATGGHAASLEFLFKPMPGQQGMVIAGLAGPLAPGVYRLSMGESDPMSGGQGFIFAVDPVHEGEASKCVDAQVTYMMGMSKNVFVPCSGAPGATEGQGGASGTTSTPDLSARKLVTACNDYAGCFNAGTQAYQSGDWDDAIEGFKAAMAHDSTKGDGWVWLGRALLGAGRTDGLPAAWDKALALGTPISLEMCRQRGIAWCERGTLLLDRATISFTGKSQLFSVPPSEVTAFGFEGNTATMQVSFFKLKVGKKDYTFDPVPVGVTCEGGAAQLLCPPPGVAQQMAIGIYVLNAIPKLASGALGKPN